MPFVPDDFEVPLTFEGQGFHLEPLGPVHNARDHEAWMSSMEHIKASPGISSWNSWPAPMSLEENLADLERHYREFTSRQAFAYSILDGDDVIGCVYIYPKKDGTSGTDVYSWMRATRADMDLTVRRSIRRWLEETWPFEALSYAASD